MKRNLLLFAAAFALFSCEVTNESEPINSKQQEIKDTNTSPEDQSEKEIKENTIDEEHMSMLEKRAAGWSHNPGQMYSTYELEEGKLVESLSSTSITPKIENGRVVEVDLNGEVYVPNSKNVKELKYYFSGDQRLYFTEFCGIVFNWDEEGVKIIKTIGVAVDKEQTEKEILDFLNA